MRCRKCKREIPDESKFCMLCGAKVLEDKKRNTKSRGNGQGSVYKLPNGKWRAVVTLGYETKDGKKRRVERTKTGFRTKREALDYLPVLKGKPKEHSSLSFKGLYDKWLPTHDAGKSTILCYKSAYKHYEALWYFKFDDIGIDDLQECIDKCKHGKRTRQNMKILATLLYKYAIPRGWVTSNINYAQFIKVPDLDTTPREAFTEKEIEVIKKSIDKVPYADYIYCMIYTGFRLSEFLSMKVLDYDRTEKCFTGGGKTTAGTNRLVTASPKIQPIIDKLIEHKTAGTIFCDKSDGGSLPNNKFRDECFYPALEKMGIQGVGEHRLTPHCTRHTFATLLKRVSAADKDKLELMGHSSSEMLRHYQHVNYDDLREITNSI